jgi:hypothetical protein
MLLGFYYVEKENVMLSTTFIMITTVLFFVLSAAVIELEFPYTAIQSDNTIVTGSHTWGDSTGVALMYLFIMLGVIEMIYGLGTIPKLIFKIFKEKHLSKYGKRSKYYKR